MNWFKQVLLQLGFVTKEDHSDLVKKVLDLEKENRKLKTQAHTESLKNKNYDALISDFEEKEMNAMAYKLINKAFLGDHVDLLKRWGIRIEKAISDKENFNVAKAE